MKRAPVGWPCNQFGWVVKCEKCDKEAKFRRACHLRDDDDLPVAWYLMLPSGPAQPRVPATCEILCEDHIKDQSDLNAT
jgi:hypothetical protein